MNGESARIYKFQADIPGDMVSYESYPIFDEYDFLIGAFTLLRGSVVIGFVSGTGSPSGIPISTGESFYFTGLPGKTGRVDKGIISMRPFNGNSVKVTGAYEDETK